MWAHTAEDYGLLKAWWYNVCVAGYRVPGTDVGSCSGTWYLDLGFQKSVALLQASPAEPESPGARYEALALEGVLCVRGQAVKEVGDQNLTFSGCFPPSWFCMASGHVGSKRWWSNQGGT